MEDSRIVGVESSSCSCGLVAFARFLAPGGLLAQRADVARRHAPSWARSAAFIFPATLSTLTVVFDDSTRTGEGLRHLGCDDRRRHCARTDRRWCTHHALLVRIDLLGQRSRGDRRHRRNRVGRARVESATTSPDGLSSASSWARRASRHWCSPSSKVRRGVGARRRRWCSSARRPCC